ncbi:unnamed protein product [Rotaria magnacalcarata]|uniref:Regulation of nuclear pre-mRNA domain-containing protein 2 n=1 Tax=Rotaria magnacalcarata TaxID=392030 RepID=A0A816MDP6_9BILA|nr:unnamed protein product [Rotaria magnacalcarata]CAF1962344.1 unnamed protein product [Rotaria magnacalcarata]CAF2005054.1 unnamed protein product [Rotaria magnacalcarata]CAF2016357.1 unnamed protein product [Rotaria magnacalcarata]CAF3789232.1 unnamed protein product [Rotaria magnacalcarata]
MAAKTTTDDSNSSSSSFEKRLTTVNSTQESVQTLSLWILYHRSQHEHLIKTWFKVLKKSKPLHRLTLFYVANDVIQNGKKHNALVYQQAFKPYLNSSMLYVKENGIRKKVQRILEIWRERGVYDEDFIDELLKKLLGTEVYEKDKEVTRVIAEFQPKSLCETLIRFKQVESETLVKEQMINNELKLIDGMSVENVRKLKDKTSTDAYYVEYENSREKFQEYIRYFERLLQERKTIKQHCKQAEIFYDAQYQDANIVVEAYKNFGDKVATLKKKLDSVIRDLPETVSPPSADNAPSPGNTPPDYRQTDMDLSDNEENNSKSPSDRTAIVRTTRADPRHNRKHAHHRHQSSQQYFDDADERSNKDNSNLSPLVNGDSRTTLQQTPMIDVNLITDLLIQHSQSTGFEKSIEMLTQTLRQLTDPNAISSSAATATTTTTITTNSTQQSNQLSQSNPFENLLMKRLQPMIPSAVLAPPVTSQVWFNSTTPQTLPSSMPPFFPLPGQQTTNVPMDFHSLQQYQNQRN